MGLFDLFKKKRQLTDEELKWNKMWDLWCEGKADSPYAELMKYQSEINNGGHDQYFTNVENTSYLKNEMSQLEIILSSKLNANLNEAYKAYLSLEKNDNDETAEEILEECDDVFYENEEEINNTLKEYASTMQL